MAKSTSKSKQGYYASYKASSKWKTNRTRKLERLLALNPNNEQIRLALKSMVYRRKTPVVPFWSHSMISEARLFKQFTGTVNKDIFSSNLKVRDAARLGARRQHFQDLPVGKVDFTLGFRIVNPASSNSKWN